MINKDNWYFNHVIELVMQINHLFLIKLFSKFHVYTRINNNNHSIFMKFWDKWVIENKHIMYKRLLKIKFIM